MGTIASYPGPRRPLEGNELLAGWQDGRQVAIPTANIAGLAGAVGAGVYRYAGFAVGAILPGEILLDHIAVVAHTIRPNLEGCGASAGTPPALPWMLTLAINDAPIGAVIVQPDGGAEFVTFDGNAHNVLAGDVVTATAPLTPDPQIARVRFTIVGEAR